MSDGCVAAVRRGHRVAKTNKQEGNGMSLLAFSGNTGFIKTSPRSLPLDLITGRAEFLKGSGVRPYRSSDRAAISQICCDTGFLGKAVEPLFLDRQLFADLFTKAYLDYEPEWALVAEADGRVVGYLLGSVRADFDRLLMRAGLYTVSRMLYRLSTGHYAQHARSRRFIRWLLLAGFREQPKHPPDSAHLHFNIDQAYRGRGLAQQLWKAYEDRLLAAGVRRCYGSFFSHYRRRPEGAYARFGFRTYDRCRTTLFQPELSHPVEVVCVWKQF